MLKLFARCKQQWAKVKSREKDIRHIEADKDELDEILQYIDEHSEELIRAEKRLNKQLPYWVCKF